MAKVDLANEAAMQESWVLFVIIMVFTVFSFRSQKYWVHYSDNGEE